jgi:hypothetical protein
MAKVVARITARAKAARRAMAILGVVLLALSSCGIAYDLLHYEPRRDDVSRLLADAEPADRHPPDAVRRLLLASQRDGALAQFVARRLLSRFGESGNDGLGWNLRLAAWTWLVRLHHDDDALVGLYATLVERDGVRGLDQLSRAIFSRPLPALDEREAALLVASLRVPFQEKARLERRADELLRRSAAPRNAGGNR